MVVKVVVVNAPLSYSVLSAYTYIHGRKQRAKIYPVDGCLKQSVKAVGSL